MRVAINAHVEFIGSDKFGIALQRSLNKAKAKEWRAERKAEQERRDAENLEEIRKAWLASGDAELGYEYWDMCKDMYGVRLSLR